MPQHNDYSLNNSEPIGKQANLGLANFGLVNFLGKSSSNVPTVATPKLGTAPLQTTDLNYANQPTSKAFSGSTISQGKQLNKFGD